LKLLGRFIEIIGQIDCPDWVEQLRGLKKSYKRKRPK